MIDVGEASRLFQAALEESKGEHADEQTHTVVRQALAELERAWLEATYEYRD